MTSVVSDIPDVKLGSLLRQSPLAIRVRTHAATCEARRGVPAVQRAVRQRMTSRPFEVILWSQGWRQQLRRRHELAEQHAQCSATHSPLPRLARKRRPLMSTEPSEEVPKLGTLRPRRRSCAYGLPESLPPTTITTACLDAVRHHETTAPVHCSTTHGFPVQFTTRKSAEPYTTTPPVCRTQVRSISARVPSGDSLISVTTPLQVRTSPGHT